MKKTLSILIISLCFLTSSQADDIRDFQIEGMSVGDSLLNFMTENEIKNAEQNSTKVGKDFLIIYYYYKPSSSKLYDYVSVTYKVNDKKYIIHGIKGILFFDENMKACEEKKSEIINEVKVLFADSRITTRKDTIDKRDKSGKTKSSSVDIRLKSDAWVYFGCTDWGKKIKKEKRWKDTLSVGIYSAEYTKFLRKHYNN